jgi:dTDP-4-dehydrorhamnose 3,5-epimerase-like enzyme
MDWIMTEGGGLGVLHFSELPFAPQRIYWLYDNPIGVERGWHAHKKLVQFVVCLSGGVEVEVDSSSDRSSYKLRPNSDGLLILPGHWRVLRNFEPDTVIVVLASEDYDPGDYIHDYEEFRAWKQTHT